MNPVKELRLPTVDVDPLNCQNNEDTIAVYPFGKSGPANRLIYTG